MGPDFLSFCWGDSSGLHSLGICHVPGMVPPLSTISFNAHNSPMGETPIRNVLVNRLSEKQNQRQQLVLTGSAGPSPWC